MKTINILISLFLLAGLLGCTDGFDALNVNPNEPTEDMYDFSKADMGTVLRDVAQYGDAEAHQRVKALGTDVFVQYVAGNATAKNWTPDDSYQDVYWRRHYNNWMATLNLIIKDAEIYPNRENSLALARIWRTYAQSKFTDFFGPAPFPKSPEDTDPDYESLDKQYEFFFQELDESVKLFDTSKDFITVQDQIYWGDITKWKRFANSLRLRLAVKLSEIAPEISKQQAQAAFAADGGLIQPGDEARIAGTTGWGRMYPYFMYQVSWTDPQMLMQSMEKILTNIGGIPYAGTADIHPENTDPRADRMFEPSPMENAWRGFTAGMRVEDGDPRTRCGRMSTTWVIPNDARLLDIFLYSEVCFLAAEAIERLGVTDPEGKTAKQWYEEGVKTSFGYWSLDDDEIEAYLQSNAKNSYGTSANYDDTDGAGNTKLEKIITQKYIAGYPDISVETWNDKRRLNLPALEIPEYRDPGAGTYPSDNNIKNPDNYISRMVYPQSEALINKAKYDAGVAQLRDGDKTSSPLWWASKRANYCTSSN